MERLCDVPPSMPASVRDKRQKLDNDRATLISNINNLAKGECGPQFKRGSAQEKDCRTKIEKFAAQADAINNEVRSFCTGVNIRPWNDLLNMRPTARVLNDERARRNRAKVDFQVQKIEDATGAHVNFDTYAIDITRMPTTGPSDPAALFGHIRQNLNTFFDHSASTFGAYTPGDAADWSAGRAAPLGSLMIFKIPLARFSGPIGEQAGVVTSASSDTMWVFSPVTIGRYGPGEHPVSGNREFGIRPTGDGKFQIYTRATDRVLASIVPGENTVFEGADKLWKSWQTRVVNYINENGGSATAATPIFHRPTWREVDRSGLMRR